tara:strand:- start:20 stop:520 length:501 start_codon:yes stop_codon:yes gene_type:complete
MSEKIISFLVKKGKISNEKYITADMPFFMQDTNKIPLTKDLLNFKKITEYNIPNNLNKNIKLLFEILGDANKEVYIGEWTIMSLKQCMERYKYYCDNDQYNVFDIGFRYMGMGHIEVISCDLKTHLLFKRPDGGSNGYDREYNLNNIIKNGPDSYEKLHFSTWFYS